MGLGGLFRKSIRALWPPRSNIQELRRERKRKVEQRVLRWFSTSEAASMIKKRYAGTLWTLGTLACYSGPESAG